MTTEFKKKIIIATILVVIALISFFSLAKVFSDPDTFTGTISVLDEKKNTVAKLSAISIGVASAIDLIPGETGQSIARELVNLGGYFVLLFAAIYLEKILITIGGYVAFKVLIPIGLFLIAGFVLFRKESLRAFGIKLISIGLVLFLLVPSSVWVSGMVDKQHDMTNQQNIVEIVEETDILEDSSEEKAEEEVTEDTAAENNDDSEVKGIKGIWNKVKGTSQSGLSKVKTKSSALLSSMKDVPERINELLDSLIDEIAYFFISICVIPIVVLVLLVVLLKQFHGIETSGKGSYAALLREIRTITSKEKESVE